MVFCLRLYILLPLIFSLCFIIFLSTPFYLWCASLGTYYPSYLKPVCILQKKAVRIITFSEPRSHSEPMFKYLNLLKFTDVVNLQILTFIFRWFHKLTPYNFNDYFELVFDKHHCYMAGSVYRSVTAAGP